MLRYHWYSFLSFLGDSVSHQTSWACGSWKTPLTPLVFTEPWGLELCGIYIHRDDTLSSVDLYILTSCGFLKWYLLQKEVSLVRGKSYTSCGGARLSFRVQLGLEWQ